MGEDFDGRIVRAVPTDGIWDDRSGNVLFAIGQDGVVVMEPSGATAWSTVGPYYPVKYGTRQVFSLTWVIIFHAATLPMVLFLVFAGYVTRSGVWGAAVIVFTSIPWAASLIGVIPTAGQHGASKGLLYLPAILIAVAAGFVAFLIAAASFPEDRRTFGSRHVATAVILSVLGVAPFLVPFFLWGNGAIPSFSIAKIWAVGMVVAYATAIFVHRRRSERLNVQVR